MRKQIEKSDFLKNQNFGNFKNAKIPINAIEKTSKIVKGSFIQTIVKGSYGLPTDSIKSNLLLKKNANGKIVVRKS